MKFFEVEKNLLKITFQINDKKEWWKTLEFVRSLKGRFYDKNLKVWYCEDCNFNREKLVENGFVLVDDTRIKEEEFISSQDIIVIDENQLQGFRNYQIEGVKFLVKKNGKGLIADDMGLGKTIQAIGYLMLNKDLRPALIVCPGSVKYNWKIECNKWIKDEQVEVIKGTKVYDLDLNNKIFIINYDILFYWEEYLSGLNFQILITDEAHYVSNWFAKRTKSLLNLSNKIPKFIALTGTPIKNKPAEFFTILHILNKDIFKSRYYYLNRYCNPKYNGFGWVYNGATNIEELQRLVKPLMIRREKNEVLNELPEKQREFLFAEGDLTEYNKEFNNIYNSIKNETNKIKVRSLIDYLKSLTWNVKRGSVLEWIDDFLENCNEKLVIFAIHAAVILDLFNKYKDISVMVDGSVNLEHRQKNIEDFYNDNNKRIFIGNIIAAGTGINLTCASKMIFVELDWVPSNHLQAEDRIYRIGQKNFVNIFYFIAKDTIENKMIDRLFEKGKILNNILETKNFDIFDKIMEDFI